MTNKKSYSELQSEFDKVVAWFESDNFSLDEAPDKYAKAKKLIKELEDYLKTAENKINKIRQEFK